MADCAPSIKFYQWIGQTRFLSLPLNINDLSEPDCWPVLLNPKHQYPSQIKEGEAKEKTAERNSENSGKQP